MRVWNAASEPPYHIDFVRAMRPTLCGRVARLRLMLRQSDPDLSRGDRDDRNPGHDGYGQEREAQVSGAAIPAAFPTADPGIQQDDLAESNAAARD